MSNLEFTFEQTPWEKALNAVAAGGSLSASRFLTLMEEENDEEVEQALLDLEQRDILLDLSDLPRVCASGEAAVRLRREEQLVQDGTLLTALEDSDPLRLYLEEIAAIPAFGDVRVLAEQCAQGDASSQEKLLNQMLSRVLELAMHQTGRGVLLLDLMQEGSLGLWQAISGYDGGDFQVFAERRIRQSMAKLIVLQARQNGVGGRLRQAMEDYRAVDERLLSELGRNATLEEIAAQLHMSVDETDAIKKMLDSARMVNRAKVELEPEEDPEEEEQHVEDTALFQMRQRIMELLSTLDGTAAKVLTLRFGLEGGRPLSPEETARRLKLTPEEVVAKEADALAQLRNGETSERRI